MRDVWSFRHPAFPCLADNRLARFRPICLSSVDEATSWLPSEIFRISVEAVSVLNMVRRRSV
jgi:hypothetical protein